MRCPNGSEITNSASECHSNMLRAQRGCHLSDYERHRRCLFVERLQDHTGAGCRPLILLSNICRPAGEAEASLHHESEKAAEKITAS